MQISIEISLYPLAEKEFKTEIWIFINRLRETDGLKVVTNGMSTQIFGEYDFTVSKVMAEIKRVHQELDAAVFVCKFISGDRSLVEAD
ncbi:MAG: hypothetical protein HRT38_06110 [Alteromonadaceae bacterium]|nr:hypothetical protein [Alteromonadaceae bacterium]